MAGNGNGNEKKSDRQSTSRSPLSSPSPPPLPHRNTSRSPDRDTPSEKSLSRSNSKHKERHDKRQDAEENVGERSFTKKGNLTIIICKDFTRGRCRRSPLDCKYAHPPPSVAIEEDKVTVCYDSLRDRCSRGLTCRYYHPPPHIRLLMQEASGIQPSPAPLGFQVDAIRPPNLLFGPLGLQHPLPVLTSPHSVKSVTKPSIEVCRDYVRGRCSREADECRYAHHPPTAGEGDYTIVCQDYLRGKCERDSCRYFHAPEHLRSRIKDLPVGPAITVNSGRYHSGLGAANAYPTAFYEHQAAKRMRIDDSSGGRRPRGPAAHQYGAPLFQVPPLAGRPFVSPPMLRSSAVSDQDRLPVCRDFQKNKCSRDSTCKFVHPEPHTQVVDNYVTVCRDFQRGKCIHEPCRFYHLSNKSGNRKNENDVDFQSSPLPDVRL
eukprot:Gb_26006 [translate_table: standard]